VIDPKTSYEYPSDEDSHLLNPAFPPSHHGNIKHLFEFF
jgi:hypothetical protein